MDAIPSEQIRAAKKSPGPYPSVRVPYSNDSSSRLPLCGQIVDSCIMPHYCLGWLVRESDLIKGYGTGDPRVVERGIGERFREACPLEWRMRP
jgi:hypothetical protein